LKRASAELNGQTEKCLFYNKSEKDLKNKNLLKKPARIPHPLVGGDELQ
jgi:hypothetical protein